MAQINFQNAHTEVKYQLKIVTFTNLLTSVAGIPTLLILVFSFMISKYQSFYTNYRLLQSLEDSHLTKDSAATTTTLTATATTTIKKTPLGKLTCWSSFKIYLFSKTMIISRVCRCLLRSKGLKSQIEMVEKAQ